MSIIITLALLLYPGISIFNGIVMHKMKKETIDTAIDMIEQRGFIFNRNFKNTVLKLADNKNYPIYDSYDTEDYFISNFLPIFNLYPLSSTVKYILGNHNSTLGLANHNFLVKLQNDLPRYCDISLKSGYITVDKNFKDKQKAMEELEKLEKKYDKGNFASLHNSKDSNKDSKRESIVIYTDDELDVILNKLQILEELISTKCKDANKDLEQELEVYQKKIGSIK